MKAVARLLWLYFGPTIYLRLVSATGLAACIASYFVLRGLPATAGTLAMALPVIGMVGLYLGTVLMPLMFSRLARSHSMGLMPQARVKLLASAFITVAIVSLPAAFLWMIANTAPGLMPAKPPDAETIATYHRLVVLDFFTIYTSSALMAGWLYVALWFVTAQRTSAGFVKGVFVLLLAVFAPTREIKTLESSLSMNLYLLAAVWTVFTLGFLFWPRIRGVVSRALPSWTSGIKESRERRERRVDGHEIDLFLGTANPWRLGLALIVPAVFAGRIGDYSPAVWLFYLTIFSTVAGAIAGQAASRSRTLWLLGSWSRAELFVRVERSFWRHNAFVLGTLSILMVAIGSYAELPIGILAVGLPLLVLGTTLSTYLGLMITHGLRWPESVLGVAVMVALMTVAVFASSSGADLKVAVAIELALSVLAVALRFAARTRWAQIDWAQCRPDRADSGRYA